MHNPLVSCIIPVYNGGAYLDECIQSVLRQSYSEIELIVVDDGSTDDTARIANSYGNAVQYIHQENGGPARARNNGVASSKGELISFLDADDLWDEHKTEKQVRALLADSEAHYSVTLMENFFSPGRQDMPLEPEGFRVSGAVEGYSPITLLAWRWFFEQVGPFDPSFPDAEDWEWFVRAHDTEAKCHIIHEILALRRIHGGNRTTGKALDNRKALLPVIFASLKRKARDQKQV